MASSAKTPQSPLLLLPLTRLATMPEIHPFSSASPPPPPSLLLFDDDDDGFGDFKFASSPAKPDDDDDWGEFVSSPLGSQAASSSFDPFPDPAPAPPQPPPAWERPRGAIPLSIFGDDQIEETDSPLENGFSSTSPSTSLAGAKDGGGSGLKGDLKDLIVDLYGFAPARVGSDAGGADAGKGDEGDFEWEFRDAFSPEGGIEKEEKILEIPGIEKIEVANGHEIEFVGGRTGKSQEAISRHRSDNIEHDLVDVYAASGGISNGFYGPLVVGNNYSIPETNQHSEWTNNGDVFQDSLENGEKGDDDEWEFQNAFSVDVTGSIGHQFVGDRMGESKEATTQHISANIEHDLFDSYAANGGISHDFYGSLVVNNYSISETNQQSESTSNGNALQDSSSIVKFVGDRTGESKQVTSQQRSANIEHDLFDTYATNSGLSNDFYGLLVDNNHSISESNQQSESTNNGNALQNSSENGGKSDDEEWEFKNAFAVVEDVTGSLRHQKILDTEAKAPVAAVEIQAEEDRKEATSSLERSNFVMKILGSASKEEQHAYTVAWSKMAQACTQELQHGAMIWAESIKANISSQILSRGIQYFIALGEIYRVAEILRASLKLYRPWILSSEGNSSELVTYLEESAETWINSGLEKALESISSDINFEYEGRAKALLQSIRLIHDLDEISLRDHVLSHENIICKLSLLPIRAVSGMGSVVWNGEHYFLKLANFWANRVSCDPVQLPHIHVS